MKKHTLKVLSTLFMGLFLVTACSKDKNAGGATTGGAGEGTKTAGKKEKEQE